ncbi:hypothetical protein DJ018_15370 [Phenylobacterium deserti]|uniref:Uncharacterized protein n=2 Tax=Phenylobacterium deserti TaxID=1914756 RepID=A0A328A9I3_9CAUL|nr:hypothetical protein DJ018_15370 [Phenylobacterium deserti]
MREAEPNPAFPRMISDYVRLRCAELLPPRAVEALRNYLVDLFHRREMPPACGRGIDWPALAAAARIDEEQLEAAKQALRPGLEALRRELRKAPALRHPKRTERTATSPVAGGRHRRSRKRSPKPIAIPSFPEPRELTWLDPPDFAAALDLHIRRHGDTIRGLATVLANQACPIEQSTLRVWRRGLKAPVHRESLRVLQLLEARWRLPAGYFKEKLPHPSRATTGQRVVGIGRAERRRLAWHLPDDFDRRPLVEQEEILDWVRRVVVSGSTDYRRYQATAATQPFGIRFRQLEASLRGRLRTRPGAQLAPAALEAEMHALLAFKTSTLAPYGYRRRGVWGAETAAQKLEQLSLLLGALAAHPTGPVLGFGVAAADLSLGMLVLPRVWDWYVSWREKRRGFFTAWEVDMLSLAVALTSPETGWLTQTPTLADRLVPIPNLVTASEIQTVQQDWSGACAAMHRIALARSKEIARVSRVHRDPFEPILPVLEAESPVREYKKIADEVVRLRPCARRYPKAAAESSRAILMVRLGLHLGFRQKNLRQLMVCLRGERPRTERQLAEARRGELRWNERDSGWEVFVPHVAFKNAGSSFFSGRAFRLVLPDVADLYSEIAAYLDKHRAVLLGPAADPGTFFVKTAKATSDDAAYDQNTFYEAWRWIIQRYGIHNPWTGRGAIKGLLPHGPHNVRDVLATHILKQTGSYEQASYAIQDTPETVAAHYGRFLPQDKAALAAQVLNQAWEIA